MVINQFFFTLTCLYCTFSSLLDKKQNKKCWILQFVWMTLSKIYVHIKHWREADLCNNVFISLEQKHTFYNPHNAYKCMITANTKLHAFLIINSKSVFCHT